MHAKINEPVQVSADFVVNESFQIYKDIQKMKATYASATEEELISINNSIVTKYKIFASAKSASALSLCESPSISIHNFFSEQ